MWQREVEETVPALPEKTKCVREIQQVVCFVIPYVNGLDPQVLQYRPQMCVRCIEMECDRHLGLRANCLLAEVNQILFGACKSTAFSDVNYFTRHLCVSRTEI